MLTPQQAEGYGLSGDGTGSVLEEYMDSLLVLPVEFRRYITLLRELDGKCEAELAEVKTKQAKLIREASERAGKASSSAEKARVIKQMRSEKEMEELNKMRANLTQKIAEKQSIAEQLYDMSEMNMKRLDGDIKFLEELFRNTGEMPDLGFSVGREVAAWMEKEDVWILAKIIEYSQRDPDKVIVADAEDSSSQFTLRTSKVAVLPEKETLSAAKARLPSRGKKIMAMYPDTTSFYKGTLVGAPYKEGSTSSTNYATARGTHPPGVILCTVQFDDDTDQVTGLTPKHAIPTKYVFVT